LKFIYIGCHIFKISNYLMDLSAHKNVELENFFDLDHFPVGGVMVKQFLLATALFVPMQLGAFSVLSSAPSSAGLSSAQLVAALTSTAAAVDGQPANGAPDLEGINKEISAVATAIKESGNSDLITAVNNIRSNVSTAKTNADLASIAKAGASNPTVQNAAATTANPLTGTVLSVGFNLVALGDTQYTNIQPSAFFGFQSEAPDFKTWQHEWVGRCGLSLGLRPSPTSLSDVAKTLLLPENIEEDNELCYVFSDGGYFGFIVGLEATGGFSPVPTIGSTATYNLASGRTDFEFGYASNLGGKALSIVGKYGYAYYGVGGTGYGSFEKEFNLGYEDHGSQFLKIEIQSPVLKDPNKGEIHITYSQFVVDNAVQFNSGELGNTAGGGVLNIAYETTWGF
jgi:hypothetical protein